jgi:hypothetical protein
MKFLGYAGLALPTPLSNIRAHAVTAFKLMMSMSFGNFAALRL